MSSHAGSNAPAPPVDQRLVAPETRYEIDEGRVVYVSPAHEPHASRHSKISALVEAHAASGFDVASDMLTRLTEIDDMAPDVSVFPAERDPDTGGRHIEQLAFGVVSSERLGNSGRKAAKLVARGVRRVFAVDVERRRAFEWSLALGGWSILPATGSIEDGALAVPLPIEALVNAAKADDAVARALLAKENPVLREALEQRAEEGRDRGRIEGKIEAVLAVLTARRLTPSAAEESVIRAADAEHVDRWLAASATCTTVAELLAR